MSANDPADDAEKIRARRLERLSRLAQAPTPTVASVPTDTPETIHTPQRSGAALARLEALAGQASQAGGSGSKRSTTSAKPEPTTSRAMATATSTSTASPPVAKPRAPVKPSATASSSKAATLTQSLASTSKSASSSSTRSSTLTVRGTSQSGNEHGKAGPAKLSRPEEGYDTWEGKKVGDVLSVTLSRSEAESTNYRKCWLKALQLELEEENPGPMSVNIGLADNLIIARLSLDPNSMSDDPDQMTVIAGLPDGETIFEYLAGCWKRLYVANREANRIAWNAEESSKWKVTFEKLKELVISYCGHTLEDPSMFPQPQGRPLGPAEFLPILLASVPISSGDPLTGPSTKSPAKALPLSPNDLPAFLTDLSNRFADDGLGPILEAILSFLFQEWYKVSPPPDLTGQEWKQYLGAILILVQVKGIAAMLPSLSVWFQSSAQPEQIEWFSLLGPMTRLNVFPREWPGIWKNHFSNSDDRAKGDIEANQANLRGTLTLLQNELFKIYNSIVRGSPEAKEQLMDFFATVLSRNSKRAGMRVDPKKVATDGYMINLETVLLRLFEPVLDVNFSKIDKIDVEYYRTSKRLDIKDETKIKGTAEEAAEYYGVKNSDAPAPSFVTELFFLLNAYQHLGVNKCVNNRERAQKNVGEIKKELKKAEADKPNWGGDGTPMSIQGEALIKKLKSEIDTLKSSVHAYDTQLLAPDLIQRNVAFLCFSMTWLIRLVDPTHEYPRKMIKLPLPEEAPLNFRMLPEYLIENISEYLEFVVRFSDPATLTKSDKETIITFILTFLSPNYVNNPFLKAKFMAILSMGLLPTGYFRRGIFHQELSYHTLATERLMPTLMRFFTDVETTGGHTQFWDKFNYRRDIDGIFKAMWDNQLMRQSFAQLRHDDFNLFVKFVNMLMSDTTFHLDESLTGLAKVNTIRAQMADSDGWMAIPEAERKDLESQLYQAESNAPFHTSMGRSHIKLIRDFTATTKEPFLTGEIVGRLAATLDENLALMTGPKMQELKLADPEKFAFKPKELLGEITQIYINLGQAPEFIRAVADDGRSYSKVTFDKWARILKNRAVMVDAEIAQVKAFSQEVEAAKATIDMEDERDIPDEFLDPLMATLMKNPVILPVSRVTVDEATIRAVLLSNSKDPFNNVPMKFEECVPDVELKAKIDAWLRQNKQGAGGGPTDDAMDVDTA